ncbi:MAG TPA: multiheme c-type cytochrome [Armatimonadota bacterium]|nr:multiheme c-type cytochrome [Armatimonadota bacterium]
MLLLEVGDAAASNPDLANMKADFYSKALAYLGYDVVGMGEWEVRFIKESGRAMPYGDSIPMICANVVDSSTGKPLAPKPYIVKKTPSGLKVGIISVVGQTLVMPEVQKNLAIRIIPPAEVLRQYVGELREKCDLVVLLSHTQREAARQLAMEVPGFDIVLGGHFSYQAVDTPERLGEAIFMHTKLGGTHVGKLALDINADRKIASFAGEYAPMSKEIEGDPEMTKLVAQLDADIAQYFSRPPTERAPALPPQPDQRREPQPFVSALKCRECHVEEYDSWSRTAHAKAFASVTKDNCANNPECLSCHATGFKPKGGFKPPVATVQLEGVQCEACHGPGVAHVRRPGKGYGAVLQSSCTQCHSPAKSPDFNFKAYKSRIAHSKQKTGSRSSATGKD